MSLRSRLEAKAARTVTLPLQVGDVAGAAAEVETLRSALAVHLSMVKTQVDGGAEETPSDRLRADELRDELQAARERQAACVAHVELRAVDDALWDEILDRCPTDELGVDLTELRPALLAASCADVELQDEAWWAEQLARPEWSKGDLLAINSALLALNLNQPDGSLGNG